MNRRLHKSLWKLLPPLLLMGFLSLASARDWRQAIGPWDWSFPRDHGSHPEFRTEWWYFTGHLRDASNNRFGYQLTFFRQGALPKAKDPDHPWSIRDIYLAHFALTDVSSNRFWYAERVSREGPGLAGAARDRMDVWLLNWLAKMEGNRIHLSARHQEMGLSLRLVPRKPLVFHGRNGLSQKGPKEGQASYYFSYTNLATEGLIKTPLSNSSIPVKGTSWFDHEFGSNQLAPDQVGWDWFSLHLSDGRELMVYFLRRKDGTIEASSSGTLVKASGEAIHLQLNDINLQVLDYWKSPQSGGRYPSRWRLKIASEKIEVELTPLVSGQELLTQGSTGIVYWEGAVAGRGTAGGRAITCEGYVELTGYAGSLGGIF
ncbi:MAG: carotenoid 1,2-hydratase [Desulfobacterota bacterium]|nr:carotenoid 1,2-hydratase [Thermodesulfobacteriota bacterium]